MRKTGPDIPGTTAGGTVAVSPAAVRVPARPPPTPDSNLKAVNLAPSLGRPDHPPRTCPRPPAPERRRPTPDRPRAPSLALSLARGHDRARAPGPGANPVAIKTLNSAPYIYSSPCLVEWGEEWVGLYSDSSILYFVRFSGVPIFLLKKFFFLRNRQTQTVLVS